MARKLINRIKVANTHGLIPSISPATRTVASVKRSAVLRGVCNSVFTDFEAYSASMMAESLFSIAVVPPKTVF